MGSGAGKTRRVSAVKQLNGAVGCNEEVWGRWVSLADLASARVAGYYAKASRETQLSDDEKTAIVNEVFRDACDSGAITLPPGVAVDDLRWSVENQPGPHGHHPGQMDRLIPIHDSLDSMDQSVCSSSFFAERLTAKTRMSELGIILYELSMAISHVFDAGLDSDYWRNHRSSL